MSDKDFVIGKVEFSTTTVARPQTFQIAVPATVAKPEPSVPLSAIRALVQQWRERAEDCAKYGDCYRRGEGWGFTDCADQLAALCPAPTEDQA